MVEILLGHIKGDSITFRSRPRFLQNVFERIAARIFLQPLTMFLSISLSVIAFGYAVSFGLVLFLMASGILELSGKI